MVLDALMPSKAETFDNDITFFNMQFIPRRIITELPLCSPEPACFKECLSIDFVLAGIYIQQYLVVNKQLSMIEKYMTKDSPKNPHDSSSPMVTMSTFYVSGKTGLCWHP